MIFSGCFGLRNGVKSTFDPLLETMSPIKGPVKRKNTSPYKKIHLFSLVLLLSHQHSFAFAPCSAPVTLQAGGPSGSRLLLFAAQPRPFDGRQGNAGLVLIPSLFSCCMKTIMKYLFCFYFIGGVVRVFILDR